MENKESIICLFLLLFLFCPSSSRGHAVLHGDFSPISWLSLCTIVDTMDIFWHRKDLTDGRQSLPLAVLLAVQRTAQTPF